MGLIPTPPKPGSWLAERYGSFVGAAFAQPRKAALLLALACVPGIVLDAQFFGHVRTALQDLLPKSAPSVKAIDLIHERLGGQAHLTVIAKSDNPQANRRFIDELGARLQQAKPPEAKVIQVRVDQERQWLLDHAALLMPQPDFDRLITQTRNAVREAKANLHPLDLGLDDDAPPQPQEAWIKLETELHAATSRYDRFPNGYFETPDGNTVVLMVWLQGSDFELEPAERLMATVHREVDAIRDHYPPGLVVAYNGEVPNIIEEHAAILADLSFSSVLVFLLVGGLIVLYFRSGRAVLAVVAGLIPGLIATFALGRIMVGTLNSNSAFLGSIIAGNGINYPLIFLAYYRATPPSVPMPTAIRTAAIQALPGTLGAAATASAAYAGLAAATLRGFSEFGLIGGAGMLATWALTFVTMPIAIAAFDPPRVAGPRTHLSAYLQGFFARPRGPVLAATLFVLMAGVGSLAGLRSASREGYFETDILTMRNRDSLRTGSASWDQPINDLFGIWLAPVVALAPTPEAREEAARRLREALTAGPTPLAERVETIAAYAPPVAEQEARLAQLRQLAPDVRRVKEGELPPSARALAKSWFSEDHLRPIQPAEVPYSLRQGLTEVDGRTDHVVLIFPSLKLNYNDARNLMRFVDQIDRVELPPGTVLGGGFLFMAEIIRLVKTESVRVIMVVCLLVSLALIPIFFRKPVRILVSVGTVAAVALSAQSIMLALGVRVNMFNFAAVPITIGVGADYVVNLFGAMDGLGVDSRRACSRMGGAILLCSMTTVVGYLSLVFAQSGALRTFGWAAVLGEIMAVTSVLLVLPAFSPPSAAPEADKSPALA